MPPHRVSCGLEVSHVSDLPALIQTSTEAGYDFTTVPIVNPRYDREFDTVKEASSHESDLDICRRELGIVLESQEKFNTPTPVLVLSCHTQSRTNKWKLDEIVEGLHLRKLSRPWAVFEVKCL